MSMRNLGIRVEKATAERRFLNVCATTLTCISCNKKKSWCSWVDSFETKEMLGIVRF